MELRSSPWTRGGPTAGGGILLYNTSLPGSPIGGITLNGNSATIGLEPLEGGTRWDGLVIFQDRTDIAGDDVTINGGQLRHVGSRDDLRPQWRREGQRQWRHDDDKSGDCEHFPGQRWWRHDPRQLRPRLHLQSCATGCSAASATGASRSRSSSTRTASPTRVPDSMLPVELPEVPDYSPKTYDPDDASSEPEPPLSRVDEWVRRRPRPRRRPRHPPLPPRDQHDAQLGRVVLVLPALPRPGQQRRPRRPRQRGVLDGAARRAGRRRPAPAPATRAASTSTSAVSSTPCCTCSTRASGTRCCTTWAT